MKKSIASMKALISGKTEPKTPKRVIRKINPQVDHFKATWDNGPPYNLTTETPADFSIPFSVEEQISIGEVRYSPLSPEEEEYHRNTHPRHWYPTDTPCGMGYIQAVERYHKRQETIFFRKLRKVMLPILGGAVAVAALGLIVKRF